MNISYPKKIIKLLINLTFKPHNIFRYLRYSIFSNKTPIDIKLPWWSFDAIDDFWRYEKLLKNNKAKRIKFFESLGPCRIGVTSTAFFYY